MNRHASSDPPLGGVDVSTEPRPGPRLVIYQWLTTPAFLAHALEPAAHVIEATPEDIPGAVLAALPPTTRAFLFHLNCTRTDRFPHARSELVAGLERRNLLVLNRHATDASKRTLQSRCRAARLETVTASRSGDPDELIIVKTNLNFGGSSEWSLREDQRRALGIGPGSSVMFTPNHYVVAPRREIERSWWTDATLCCERYISNREGLWYRVLVVQDRLAVCELASGELIKKIGSSNVRNVWLLDDARPEGPSASLPDRALTILRTVRRLRAVLDLEYGALDLVVDDDGRAYAIDVNTTPAYNHPLPGLVEHLRAGLDAPASR